ncbi:glucose-6-phosphate 1-dehydrogenase [Plasticicumulans lactativorans]|uniref:Glucose-6-phosphate 1-dehydrogenase n=1 Tax=Plasticicumulans lactativorans TaxID=1133106 RepID=A0A4R2L884_9GAMM|nr:glucose-6-phosphate dehydrogenase [Plasticicumulans lactativorans]TCO81557.1 glucose-6-phosphate 1-dehydrogenase [Plasticicumulans lactativorans]
MQAIPNFDLVIFGGNGDLAMRKLLPALFHRHRDGDLPVDGRILAVSRTELTRETFVAQVHDALADYVAEHFDAGLWATFAERLDYLRVDANTAEDYAALADALGDDPARVRVFYLSTSPDLFSAICRNLAAKGMVTPATRVVLEKPLGRDLASAQRINEDVGAVFQEHQIYRIDHYLGKETVQNMMALRFGNSVFEPLWRRTWVSHVQITVAEQLGVEGRGEFYNRAGAMRDMIQNHLLQLLCIVAMEPPARMDQDAVRDEKLKILRSLRPMSGAEVGARTVRGQYRAGVSAGKPVPGYLDEPGIPSGSRTETFVALKAEITNWRWAGTPFYLRTGKRMQEGVAEIVLYFRDMPMTLFPTVGGVPNRLVIRLQPDEGLRLDLMAKQPGDDMLLRPVGLNLNFAETFRQRPMQAYERLLTDVIRGRLALFMRRDELEAAWTWVEPILHAWEASSDSPKSYTAGTWGPAAATALISRDGFAWHEDY